MQEARAGPTAALPLAYAPPAPLRPSTLPPPSPVPVLPWALELGMDLHPEGTMFPRHGVAFALRDAATKHIHSTVRTCFRRVCSYIRESRARLDSRSRLSRSLVRWQQGQGREGGGGGGVRGVGSERKRDSLTPHARSATPTHPHTHSHPRTRTPLRENRFRNSNCSFSAFSLRVSPKWWISSDSSFLV
jgi:hypothetical protein